MSWQVATYQLKSDGELLMHNGRTANPIDHYAKLMKKVSGKKKKTDSDHEELARLEFFAGLYLNTDGPYLPKDNIDSMILAAARKLRQGPLAQAGVFCKENARLEYEGPRTAEELWKKEEFRHSAIVRVRAARIARTRPIFAKWEATVNVAWENSIINVEMLDEWMEIAGQQVGLGDWRPKYGRFTAERIS